MTSKVQDLPRHEPPRPRVLFLHQGGELYGSDRVFLDTVRSLSCHVDPIVVIDFPGPLLDQLRGVAKQVHVRRLGVLRRILLGPVGGPLTAWRLITAIPWLVSMIRKNDISLVYSNTLGVLAGSAAAYLTGRPHLWHVHEMISRPGWAAALLAWLAGTFSHGILVPSQAAADHLRRFFGAGKPRLWVAYNSISTERFDGLSPGSIRRELGIQADDFVILMVGRISRSKGQEYLLDILHAMVRGGFNRFRALVVGDVFAGYEFLRPQLQHRIEELRLQHHVTLCGWREDIPSLMTDADVVVVPSLMPEPFGLVILEAMAARKPVVATAHGGPCEIVLHGRTGFLIPLGEPAAAAKVLVELAQDPRLREQMGMEGYRLAKDRFNLEHYSQGIWEHVSEMLRLTPNLSGSTGDESP